MLSSLYMCLASGDDTSLTFSIHLFDIGRVIDKTSSREIRTFDDFHDFIDGNLVGSFDIFRFYKP
jgi:hypothetical protein